MKTTGNHTVYFFIASLSSVALLLLLAQSLPAQSLPAQSPVPTAGQDKLKAAAKTAKLELRDLKPVKDLDGFVAAGTHLLFEFNDSTIEFARQYNVVEEVFAVNGKGEKQKALLRQGPHQWIVTRSDPSAMVGVIRFRYPYESLKSAPRIQIDSQTPTRFPARFADINSDSEKLQFEPLAYKNTVGYWVNPKETPHWNFEIKQAGKFRLRILQGCGKGQGGSEIEIQVGKRTIPYSVVETGQFQAFRWFDVGEVQFERAEVGKIRINVKKLAKNAVMDVREIRLEPIEAIKAQKPKPNVVIFYTDDQGTLDANCFGSRDLHTPNIDGLAHAGIRFTQAYAHTVCCPSRAMLMTGRVPQRSNVNNWTQGNAKSKPGRNMNLDEKTLAEYLKGAGYATALFGKWHLGAATTHGPTRQGFDEFFGLRGGFIDNFNHYFLHGSGFHDLYEGTKEVFHRGEYFPDLVTQRAIEFLQRRKDQNFFLCVPFNIPHYPEQSDSVFEQRYSRLPEPRQSYAKIVSTTDERIGQVLRKLDELRLRDNTIVIFMSDNGHSPENYSIRPAKHASGLPQGHNYGANGGGGNTGKWRGAKGSFFEGGIRVPAIISFPRQLPSGLVRDQAITACDWLPTVLDLCGVEASTEVKLDGASLLPIIHGDAATHHKVMHWQWQNKWATREGDWKLIGNPKSVQLYHLAGENPESMDYAPQKPELVKRLKKLHDEWIAEVSK